MKRQSQAGSVAFLQRVFASRELVSALAGGAGLRLLSTFLFFALSVVLARLLGPMEYGDYTFGMTVAALLALLAAPGLALLVTRESARYDLNDSPALLKGLLRRSRQAVLISSMLIFALAQLTLLFLEDLAPQRREVLRVAFCLVPLLTLLTVHTGVLNGLRMLRTAVVTDSVLRSALMLCGATVLASAGLLDAVSATWIQFICAGLALLSSAAYLRHKRIAGTAQFETKTWRKALAPFAWIAIVGYLNLELVSLALGFSHPAEELAYFRVSFTLGMVVALPLSIIESMALPYITRFYDKGDMQGLRQAMRLSAQMAVGVSALPTLVVVVFGEWFLLTIFGEVYTVAFLPLVALSLGHFATNFLGLSMPLLYATEYHKEAAQIGIVGAAINVGLCVILIPALGALGAALAFSAGKVIRSALYLVVVRRRLGIGTTVFG